MKLKYINYGMLILFVALIYAAYQITILFELESGEGDSILVREDLVISFSNWIIVLNIIANSIFLWFAGQGIYQIVKFIKRKRNGERNTAY